MTRGTDASIRTEKPVGLAVLVGIPADTMERKIVESKILSLTTRRNNNKCNKHFKILP